jgi:hypothetical protein
MGVDASKVRPGRRVLLALGVLAACIPSLACVATSVMTATTQTPVLIGPVACIGCRAGAAPPQTTAAIADSAVHTSGYVTLPRIGDVGFFGDTPATIDAKAFALAPDPCTADVHLSKITAGSFGVVALVYADAKQTVPGGSCLMPSGPYVVTGGGAPPPSSAPGGSP